MQQSQYTCGRTSMCNFISNAFNAHSKCLYSSVDTNIIPMIR